MLRGRKILLKSHLTKLGVMGGNEGRMAPMRVPPRSAETTFLPSP
jgi:hypothetical protein